MNIFLKLNFKKVSQNLFSRDSTTLIAFLHIIKADMLCFKFIDIDELWQGIGCFLTFEESQISQFCQHLETF